MNRKNTLILILCAGALAVFSFAVFQGRLKEATNNNMSAEQKSTLPLFTEAQLHDYDGTDPALPIYIGLDGYVYDITLGKEYYAPGGRYHDLAGRDSSKALRFMGADIIKEKYPQIGTLASTSIVNERGNTK